MGWNTCYNHLNKKDVVNDFLQNIAKSGYNLLGHASTTSGVYAAVTKSDYNGILCLKVEKHGKLFSTKSMSEGMGPAMDDCPLRLLDLVKGPCTEYALKWREGVRAFHANKLAGKELAKSITPGATIMLYKQHFTVLQNNGNHLIVSASGMKYKINQNQFASLSIEGS